ncbi:MAG TPA: class I SAM-dependent methyltransferase [Bryobacteraceae bacterium]|jgi:SAM-dependent methyltransferase|nr:class I SAM-dependent methyltransferase [Bryobacteraceae bacterium]
MYSHINFGYAWYWTYGHLLVTAIFLPLFWLAWIRKWPKPLLAILGAVTLWSIAAFLVMRLGMNMNGRAPLPTEAFLPSGSGRVLDMGAGTGRSTLMVLEARPRAFVMALDSFSDEYVHHFGNPENGKPVPDQGRERLLLNLKTAGVDQRATIQAGDMRQMPIESAAFDGIVSAYAIDHLNRDGRTKALGEAARVLKPGGQFLLMVIAKDLWMDLTWGPLLMHARLPGRDCWEGFLRDAGFQVLESGTRPATLYFLARKP